MHTYIHMSLQGVCLSSRGFVRGLFLWKVLFRGVVRSLSVRTLPLQLNITFNIRFHMFQRNFKSVTSHALGPLLLSQTVTPSRTPPLSSVTYFILWSREPNHAVESSDRSL